MFLLSSYINFLYIVRSGVPNLKLGGAPKLRGSQSRLPKYKRAQQTFY